MNQENDPLDEEQRKYRDLLDQTVQNTSVFDPTLFKGRGIVICGGGRKYFPGVYVNIRALRHFGCVLPIELWHLGEEECTPEMRASIEPYGVKTVDGHVVREQQAVHAPGGWELKCLSLMFNSFEEVLLLDADNLPVRNPEFLFETPEYREHGAVFWPDYGRLNRDRLIWGICGVPYRNEPEFESGQILVDKSRCWKALQIAMHLNEHSGFYYRHIHGDKETFHMAWRKLDQSYAMPKFGIFSLPNTMCQHDFEGRRLFQHRNMDKWRARGCNARIPGFEFEDDCIAWLKQLAELWDPVPANVRVYSPELRTPQEMAVVAEITAKPYDYHRIGADRRPLSFQADGRIGQGAAGCEMWWDLARRDGKLWLEVFGENGLTMRLARDWDGVWRGRWEHFERMPIELTPSSTLQKTLFTVPNAKPTLEVRIVSGCRRTYRHGMGLPDREIPPYLEQTLESLGNSDIPMNMVTVFVDSLGANFLTMPERGGLRIAKAVYRGREGREIEVTAKVSALADGNTVLLIATDEFAGGDPDPGTDKTLVVEYSLTGHQETVTVPEGAVRLIANPRTHLDDRYVASVRRCAKQYRVPVIISTGGGLHLHLPEVFRHPPRADYMLVLEDDVTVDPEIYEKTLSWIQNHVPELVFGSLYNIYNGRTVVACTDFYSAQAIVLRTDRLEEILHCLVHYEAIPDLQQEGWMDIRLSRIVGNVLRSPIHIHPDSLVQHVGEVSKWRA